MFGGLAEFFRGSSQRRDGLRHGALHDWMFWARRILRRSNSLKRIKRGLSPIN
jgi:hypothetical protein